MAESRIAVLDHFVWRRGKNVRWKPAGNSSSQYSHFSERMCSFEISQRYFTHFQNITGKRKSATTNLEISITVNKKLI